MTNTETKPAATDDLPFLSDSSNNRCARCGKKHGNKIEFQVEVDSLGFFQVGATCAKKLIKAGFNVESL